jgi:hypothetical protein
MLGAARRFTINALSERTLLEPTRNLLDKATCIFHTQGTEVRPIVSRKPLSREINDG